MPDDLATIAASAAAAAWLTKTIVDLIRQRVAIDGGVTLAVALVVALITNVAWALYKGAPFAGPQDYALVAIQSVLAFLGAVATTAAQNAAAERRAGK